MIRRNTFRLGPIALLAALLVQGLPGCAPGDLHGKPDILLITGYSEKINPQIVKEIGIKELAMKPVVMKDIARMIQRVLSKEADGRSKTAKAG